MSENKYKYILHVKSSLPDIYGNRYHAASITNVESGLSVEFLTDTETNLKHRLNHVMGGDWSMPVYCMQTDYKIREFNRLTKGLSFNHDQITDEGILKVLESLEQEESNE